MATVYQSRFARPAQQQESTEGKIKEPSVWLNVGYYDKELDTYISLPVNLNLSTLPLRKEVNSDTDYAKIVAASNKLAKALLEKGKKLQPGEVRDMPEGMLTLQLMKTNTPKLVDEPNTESGNSVLESILGNDW